MTIAKVNILNNAKYFVTHIRSNFIGLADKVDLAYPEIKEFFIDDQGVPTLKRRVQKRD